MIDGLGRIDDIEVEYQKKGKHYADWQKERYPVRVRKDDKETHDKGDKERRWFW